MFDEWQHIDWMRKQLRHGPDVIVGAGDDAAVLSPTDRGLLVTTDMLVEGVHFQRSSASAYLIGKKGMNVNLSDIAAMAGEPTAAVVAVALPPDADSNLPQELFRGLKDAADLFNVAIVGGDTNRSSGPLVISTTVLGSVSEKGPVLRSGARPGDVILVTGRLGYSRDGKHLDFVPRVKESLALHSRYALHAMIDLSDGLGGDIFHIAQESSCGAILDAEAIPIRQTSQPVADDARTPLDHAMNDGEDFELLFTVSREEAKRIELEQPLNEFLTAVTAIGEVIAERKIFLRRQGGIEMLDRGGFTHRI